MTTAIACRLSGLLCLVAALGAPGRSSATAAEAPRFSHGVLIRVEGTVLPGMVRYLDRKLAVAKEEGADLVIVEIDSPGGLVEESKEIAWKLQELDWARTVAFVPDMALSGAAIASLGCDDIIMAHNATFGDAGPIVMGNDRMFEHATEKVVSHLATVVRGLAEAKGRPTALAEAMVDRTLVVYKYHNAKTNQDAYMSERQVQGLPDAADWKQGPAVEESGGNRFLEVTGKRAVELGLAQGNAANREQLAERYGLEALRVIEPGGVDTAVDILNSPLVTGLLLAIGLIALYVEFMTPGMGLGGVIAILCFAVFFWSHFLGGTAGWLGVVLFLAGLGLLAVELFVLPGTAIPGMLGVVLILVSLVMSQSTLIPKTVRELQMLANALLMVLLSGAALGVAMMTLGKHFGSLPLFGRLSLAPPAPSGDGGASTTAVDGFLPPPVREGSLGTAHTPLRPGGKARFGDAYVDVLTLGDFVNRGARLRVARVSGQQVFVEVVDEQGTA